MVRTVAPECYRIVTIRFGQPEIRLGIVPEPGGTQRLPRLIGPAKQAIEAGLETDMTTGLEIERLHFAGLFATATATPA